MRTPILIVILAVALAGCEKSEPKKQEAKELPPEPTTTAAPAATTAAATPAKPVVELSIASVGDTMAFDKTKLTAPAGSKVHLVLKNAGKMAAMKHNWVLVKKGKEAEVALAGLEKAPDAGYVVPGDDVLAYTPLAEPGQTVEVTFDAPPAGTYPYICTFPGHYMVMKGELTVTP